MEKKLGNWSFHSINIANGLILIKQVLQAMPFYHLSVIVAPKYILKVMQNLQRDFLWGTSKNKKKWDLVAWETTCVPKLKGGPGLRDK
jgi:hypothetical protein